MEEYILLLQKYDWLYSYTDDHSVWLKGEKQAARLQTLRRELDQQAVIWDQYAPQGFKLGVPSGIGPSGNPDWSAA